MEAPMRFFLALSFLAAITGLAAAAETYYPKYYLQQEAYQLPSGHCGEDPMPPDCY
jgi:hypothetical protein